MSASTPSYRKLFWIIAFCGLVLDLGSKYGIFAALYNDGRGSEIALIPDTFQLVASYTGVRETQTGILPFLRTISGEVLPRVNQGALFGMGQGGNPLFGIVSVVAALGIIIWSFRASFASDGWLAVALGFILAGTFGNLYDRVVFGGVRDFFHWYRFVDWPVFNVADICLVCGAGVLLVQAFFFAPESEMPGAETTLAK